MSRQPRLLDLFCGAGGSTMGLYRAGFKVVGVDIKPQPHYPFEFHQADALTYPLEGYDAYWASPPCQRYCQASACRPGLSEQYPDLIGYIRARLKLTSKPYVIENVPWALPYLQNPLTLCGTMFGLKVKRHRLFECYPEIYPLLPPCGCRGSAGYTAASNGFSSWKNRAKLISVAGHNFAVADAREAMGILWMTRDELSQAIPPAYSEYIGKQLIEELNRCQSFPTIR